MIQNRTLIGILLAVVLLGMVPAFSLAAPVLSPPAQEGTIPLTNPGFEGGFGAWNPPDCPSCHWGPESCGGSICQTAQVSAWWIPFWRNCGGESGCTLGMPEYKPAASFPGAYAERVHSGSNAQQYFSFARTHDGGMFQTVTSLQPGATVALSAYAQGWSSNDGDFESDDPLDNLVFRVGIDPNGGLDPWSPSIAWSAFRASPDAYNLIGPVEAQVGAEGKITVFLHSIVQHWPFMNNDAYWDDVSLVYTTPPATPTNTPVPPPPTATPGPSPTPLPPPTPRPDGATVHIVEDGDTLFGIALMYGMDADQIRRLNAGSLGPNDMIWPGQELVISISGEAPTPTPLPAPPTLAPTPVTDSTVTEIESGGASICVLAYHDRNSDTFWDGENEELLPNAEFTVADASGVADRYTSDGVHEPHCFAGLAPGAYRVIQNAPPGYALSGPGEWPVALAEGTSLDLQFGNVRGENPTTPGETAESMPVGGDDNEPTDGDSTFRRVFAIVAKVSGVLVLVLAAGVAVLFVLNRRRM
jgi:LysM repeat protein